MSEKKAVTETQKISELELQMQKGVDSVFYEDRSYVSVCEDVLAEIEQLIGKEETMRMFLEISAKDLYSVFPSGQLEVVSVLVERMCKSLKTLSDAHGRWSVLLGRIYSELEAYDDLEVDEEND